MNQQNPLRLLKKRPLANNCEPSQSHLKFDGGNAIFGIIIAQFQGCQVSKRTGLINAWHAQCYMYIYISPGLHNEDYLQLQTKCSSSKGLTSDVTMSTWQQNCSLFFFRYIIMICIEKSFLCKTGKSKLFVAINVAELSGMGWTLYCSAVSLSFCRLLYNKQVSHQRWTQIARCDDSNLPHL